MQIHIPPNIYIHTHRVSIHFCKYTHIYIDIWKKNIYIYIIYTHIQIHRCKDIRGYIQKHIHNTYTHTSTHAYIHAQTHICLHVYRINLAHWRLFNSGRAPWSLWPMHLNRPPFFALATPACAGCSTASGAATKFFSTLLIMERKLFFLGGRTLGFASSSWACDSRVNGGRLPACFLFVCSGTGPWSLPPLLRRP